MYKSFAAVKRFYSLDILRGLAALSVVFWHWQHFFYLGINPGTFDVTRFPLYRWFFVFYLKGWLAVDLFFCLSGFIFYWLYAKRISDGLVSIGDFTLLRFSRLYPLHIATLCMVAVGQLLVINITGSYFVYSNNDVKHFLLNLFFASSWGFEQGSSFNGPVWSVSVEVLLYAFFFLCSRYLPVRLYLLLIIAAAGFINFDNPIGRGAGSFFLGGCVFLLYRCIVSSRKFAVITYFLAFMMVASWVLTIVIAHHSIDLILAAICDILFLSDFDVTVQNIFNKIIVVWPIIVLFPLTILSLALMETRRGALGRALSCIGDISYSSYLLHFPLQILFFFVVMLVGNDSVYYSPWVMLLFFLLLIASCLVSFNYFELPMQKILRQVRGAQAKHESKLI